METLSPYLGTINGCIHDGFQDFFEANGFDPSLVKGTKAGIIHDRTVSRVEEAFENHPKAKTFVINGLFLLKIEEQYLIRFKKLNSSLRPSNIPTQQQFDFESQMSLPGIPGTLIKLTAGYVPNQFWTKIDSAHLVCHQNEVLLWEHELILAVPDSVITFPDQKTQEQDTPVKRIKKDEAAIIKKRVIRKPSNS